MGVIFWFSDQPGSVEATEYIFGDWNHFVRKCAHFAEYAILTFCVWQVLGQRGWTALVALLYACSDEFHQSFIPNRGSRVTDVLIDGLGILFALWIIQKNTPTREDEPGIPL